MTELSGPAMIDVSVAHPARRYDYWLGGKDNFAADRASGDAIAAVFPHIRTAARANRAFLTRGVTYLTREAGVRQFLDIGTGLPTAGNTHHIAQAIDPTCRIVYADNDPLVMAHARALLTSHPEGATAYLHGDLRDPAALLTNANLTDALDLDQPVGLLLVAVLHFIADADQPAHHVQALLDALAPGSYLMISHASSDHLPADTAARLAALPAATGFTDRTHAQIATFLDGLDPVAPGLVPVSDWRPDPAQPQPAADQVAVYGAVARKPTR